MSHHIMPIDPITASVVSALVTALIAAIIALYNSRKQRDAEAYRHFGTLALQAALAERAIQVEALRKWESSHMDRPAEAPEVWSLDILLIDKLALIQQFGDGRLTPENVAERVRNYRAVSDKLTAHHE